MPTYPNGCVHCDALQGAFFENEVFGEDAAALTVDCKMARELFDGEWRDTPLRWVFDERFESGADSLRTKTRSKLTQPTTAEDQSQSVVASESGRSTL